MKINVNNKKIDVIADPMERLIDVLRGDLKLTGTKEGCGEGECGACSVILNDLVVNSCLVPFGQIQKSDKIITVEGLFDTKEGKCLQEAFVKGGAIQCGFCTPGILIASYALLKKTKNPAVEEIKEAIAGNLCRCTGYTKIIESIITAVKNLEEPQTKQNKNMNKICSI